MTFSAKESSVQDGIPITLFLFSYGGAEYRYTDNTRDIVFDLETYSAAPIKAPALSSSGKMDRANVKISMANNLAFTDVFRGYPPSEPITLVMREGHVDDPDNEFLVSWMGTVMSSSRTGGTLEVTCEPVDATLKRPGLRLHYQIPCPLVLYSARCGANKAAKTRTAAATALSGNQISFSTGWEGPIPREKFIGGLVEWAGPNGLEVRSIIRVTATAIVTTGFPSSLIVSQVVSIVAGCNHMLSDCETLHNNVQNYGGCPWIPLVNPVKTNPF